MAKAKTNKPTTGDKVAIRSKSGGINYVPPENVASWVKAGWTAVADSAPATGKDGGKTQKVKAPATGETTPPDASPADDGADGNDKGADSAPATGKDGGKK